VKEEDFKGKEFPTDLSLPCRLPETEIELPEIRVDSWFTSAD